MTGIIVGLIAKLGLPGIIVSSGLAGGLLIALAKKYIPNFLGDWLKSCLAKELQPNMTDPVEKELFTDMVKGICRFVGYKIPDSPGKEKFIKVKNFLMKFVSEKYADEIVGIIEEAVKRMDAEVTKVGDGKK
jgi:hypothetical protein